MTTRTWFINVVCAVALMSACGARTVAPPAATAIDPDMRFLTAAAIYESFQVEAATLAATHARSAAVKNYAAHAAIAHRAVLNDLTQLAQTNGLGAPNTMLNDDYRAYVERLRTDDPTPFDVRYVSEQTLVTMSMAGRYDAFTSTAPDSVLKRWAASRSADVHADINAARQLASDANAH